jgi:hypothetical protein
MVVDTYQKLKFLIRISLPTDFTHDDNTAWHRLEHRLDTVLLIGKKFGGSGHYYMLAFQLLDTLFRARI